MGFWEFIGSTAEAVKRNAPDATPVKEACKSSYNYSAAAVNKIDQTVRIDGLNKLMPDDETKYKIGVYGAKFAQNAGQYALREGYTLIPGGVAISKIIENTMNDVELENLESQKLEENSKKQIMGVAVAVAEKDGKAVGSISNSNINVIGMFMREELFTTRFFNNMIVHQSPTKKGNKPV